MGVTTITKAYGEAGDKRRGGLPIPFVSRPLIAALVVLLIASLSMMPANANAQAPPDTVESDRAVLVALYHATDGPNWRNRTNWLSDAPLNEWHGITTDGSGRVVTVDLFLNGLAGSMPTELGNLTALRTLTLSGSSLSGPIPSELGRLANLEKLSLIVNRLSGTIPPELGNLHKLRLLTLSANQLTGTIPPQLGRLANLEKLVLADNQLSGAIPTELGNLHKLQLLTLRANQLSGAIPTELGGLTNLEELDLSENVLTGSIPPELGSLTNLRILNLFDNRLSSYIPPEVRKLGVPVYLDQPPPTPTPIATFAPIGAVAQDGAVVRLALSYYGRPISQITDAVAEIRCLTEDWPAVEVEALVLYDGVAERYEVRGLGPGRYWVDVFVDAAEPFNGERGFGLDFEGVGSFEISGDGGVVEADVHLTKHIRLTAPVDNLSTLGGAEDGKNAYPPGPLLFSWEEVPEAETYFVHVGVWGEGFSSFLGGTTTVPVEEVLARELKETSVELDLEESREGEFYGFEVTAFESDAGSGRGAQVASLSVRYSGKRYGPGYYFRIVGGSAGGGAGSRGSSAAETAAPTPVAPNAPAGESEPMPTPARASVVAPVPAPKVERGFFTNSVPSPDDVEAGLPFDIMDPVTLSLIGVLVTLGATAIQLFRGK